MGNQTKQALHKEAWAEYGLEMSKEQAQAMLTRAKRGKADPLYYVTRTNARKMSEYITKGWGREAIMRHLGNHFNESLYQSLLSRNAGQEQPKKTPRAGKHAGNGTADAPPFVPAPVPAVQSDLDVLLELNTLIQTHGLGTVTWALDMVSMAGPQAPELVNFFLRVGAPVGKRVLAGWENLRQSAANRPVVTNPVASIDGTRETVTATATSAT
jgi:hypothetical protein